MCRAIDALKDWLQLRARLRNEHQFHIDRAAAEFRALGLSSRAANRAARRRFGSRKNLKLALRELDADWAGLIRLALAHRVDASPWFQPTVLIMAATLILFLCPAPRAAIEGIAGQSLAETDRGCCSFPSRRGTSATWELHKLIFNPSSPLMALPTWNGISRSMRGQEPQKELHLLRLTRRFRLKPAILRLRVVPMFERQAIVMGPAKAVWGFIAFVPSFLLVPLGPSSKAHTGGSVMDLPLAVCTRWPH